MTDEQINVAIAEACGWTVQLSRLEMGLEVVRNRERKTLPNYCGDLNAMHSAEKTLCASHLYRDYALLLGRIVKRRIRFDAIHATARQRAEAFLVTIGKWQQ